MKMGFNPPELILPAGNFQKLKYALAYGADAVYAGPPDCSLRARLNEFDMESLKEAIEYTKLRSKKIYITLNLFARNSDFWKIERYVKELEEYAPSAFIVSDPGVVRFLKKLKIKTPLHLSTQANTLNFESVRFWEEAGIERIILARELNYDEIVEIRENCRNVELEIFIHGAMCMAYSGRCILSLYFTGREGNRGDCSHTCRWKYYLIEEKRADDPIEIEEHGDGSYILSSRDLCLINYLEELKSLHLDGYKIEGRTKNVFYVSLVARAYRMALDRVYNLGDGDSIMAPEDLINLLDNHGYTTGFIFRGTDIAKNEHLSVDELQNPFEKQYKKQYIVGLVREADSRKMIVEVKNPLRKNDTVLAISPDMIEEVKILSIRDGEDYIDMAYGAKKQIVTVQIDRDISGSMWNFGILVKKHKPLE